VTPYVIYGVRWNDLPPFKLLPDEGNCTYLGKSCIVSQTIRFSTQPLCWYCLFKDAEKKAQIKPIVGCSKAQGTFHGNVMTRSHFGDLQFLHAMASEKGVHLVQHGPRCWTGWNSPGKCPRGRSSPIPFFGISITQH